MSGLNTQKQKKKESKRFCFSGIKDRVQSLEAGQNIHRLKRKSESLA